LVGAPLFFPLDGQTKGGVVVGTTNPSLTSARYVLTFNDDLSHYTWVYFLKNKIHVFEIFNEFRALDEKQCGQPIKCLKSDNGEEYVGRRFEDYLVQSRNFMAEVCPSHSLAKWSC
jgi:hypothetical protein